MRNFSKLVLALVVFISLMGFEKNSKIEKPSINKTIVVTDTLTWKLLGDIKYIRKKHATYGEVEFPQVNLKLKAYHNKTILQHLAKPLNVQLQETTDPSKLAFLFFLYGLEKL